MPYETQGLKSGQRIDPHTAVRALIMSVDQEHTKRGDT